MPDSYLLSFNLVALTPVKEVDDVVGVQNEHISTVDTVNGAGNFADPNSAPSLDLVQPVLVRNLHLLEAGPNPAILVSGEGQLECVLASNLS